MAQEHVDLSVLGTLREVMESEYPALLDVFIKDSAKRVSELSQLIRTPGFSVASGGQLQQLGMMAHSFKGSSSNMGATRLTELCRQLEEFARAPTGHNDAQVNQMVQAISEEFDQVHGLFHLELHSCSLRDLPR